MGKISNLREGKVAHSEIIIDGMKMAVVILSSDIIRKIEESVGIYIDSYKAKLEDKSVQMTTMKNLYFDQLLCYHCLRDIEDVTLQSKMADNVEEIIKVFDVNDISRVTAKYNELMMMKYEGIELLTEKKLEEVKKHLGQIELKDLNTVLQLHLMNYHQAMLIKI